MTFEQYGAFFGGDVRAIVAAAVIDGKLIVVLRFGTECEQLEPIARANVEAEMARLQVLHPDTLKQFFGDPDFVEEPSGNGGKNGSHVPSKEAVEEGGTGPSEVDDEIAAGFAVLVEGEVSYVFVCQYDIIAVSGVAKKNLEHVGPYILGIKQEDRAVKNPALRLGVRAACEWAAGGPTEPCYFLSDSQADRQLEGLGVVGEKIEVRFKFGSKRQKCAVLTFQAF
jgi:hypothetical protein